MAKATLNVADPAPLASFEPLFAFSTALTQNLLRLQQMQLDALLSCQQSMVAIGQEFYDEWACRFAGGAPIDG